jgi:hypothetical protein
MNPVLQFVVDWLEAKFPQSKAIIDLFLPYLSGVDVTALLLEVIHDYQSGMSFYAILIDVLSTSSTAPPEVVAQAKTLAPAV